jgi:hypothetical protein
MACSHVGKKRSPAEDNLSERVVRTNSSAPRDCSTLLTAALAVAVRMFKWVAAAVMLLNLATFNTTVKSSNSIDFQILFDNVSFIVLFIGI